MMRIALALTVLGAALGLAGCGSVEAKGGSSLLYKKPTAYYYEIEKDGKYYVFASNIKATEFLTKGKEPVMTNLICAGPDRKTVCVECDKGDNPEPAARLTRMFFERHPR